MIELNKLTVPDLEDFPWDGKRYELIDGELFINGEEPTRHDWACLWLYTRLGAACPPSMDLEADLMSILWRFNRHVDPPVRPHILVAPHMEIDDEELPGPPLLAIEVLTPGQERTDLETNKEIYARFGLRSYWVVDPGKPNLTAYELDENGKYRTVAKVSEDEPFVAILPFPVRIVLTEPMGRQHNKVAIGADPERSAP